MSPFAGVGVNAAMEDSLDLALALINEPSANIAPAIASYEKAMFVRAERYARSSQMFLNLFFNERAGVAMVEHFARMRAQEEAE